MNPLLFLLLSGHLFFIGATLVVAGIGISAARVRWAKRLGVFAVIVGVLAAFSSSTPITTWNYLLLSAALLLPRLSGTSLTSRRVARWMAAAIWIIAALWELRHHRLPALDPAGNRRVTVIGDSISAGIGDAEKSETWPRILAREHGLAVQDLSRPGETVSAALKRIQREQIESSVVILEIGGNDLLGGGSAQEFARELDELLSSLSRPGRQLVLFELPLPPFHGGFARVQRRLAAKHGVKLLPRRVLLSVLAEDGVTVDSIHLSTSGHKRMSEVVWKILRGAYDAAG